jgi:hypothetical protein
VVLGATPSRPSWLRVSKVEVPALPAVPDPLRADLAEYAQKRGDDVEAVRSRRQRWVATVWTDWAQLTRRAARQLYQRLYDMRLRLERYSVTHGFETTSRVPARPADQLQPPGLHERTQLPPEETARQDHRHPGEHERIDSHHGPARWWIP